MDTSGPAMFLSFWSGVVCSVPGHWVPKIFTKAGVLPSLA